MNLGLRGDGGFGLGIYLSLITGFKIASHWVMGGYLTNGTATKKGMANHALRVYFKVLISRVRYHCALRKSSN